LLRQVWPHFYLKLDNFKFMCHYLLLTC
jgi:hypothetical protein